MYKDYKVVVLIFAGRQRSLELLLPQLQRHLDIIDGVHMCMMVRNHRDKQYIQDYASKAPWLTLLERENREISYLEWWDRHRDPKTIYVKIDDDVVFIGKDSLTALLDCRIANREPFLISGNVINSDVRQRDANTIHRAFLVADEDTYKKPDATISERLAINVVAYFGGDIPPLTRHEGSDEKYLGEVVPYRTKRPCMIAGSAIFSHLAFGHQHIHRSVIDAYRQRVHGQGT